MTYCSSNAANLPGSGWRLPSIIELATIVDNSRTSPAIDSTYFPNTQWFYSTSHYWSSTNDIGAPLSFAWAMDYKSGFVISYGKPYEGYARCVRGGQ